jgi:hypothetical protein
LSCAILDIIADDAWGRRGRLNIGNSNDSVLSDRDNIRRRSSGGGVTIVRNRDCLDFFGSSCGGEAGAGGRQGVCWLWDFADINGRVVNDVDSGGGERIVYGDCGRSSSQEDGAGTKSASISVVKAYRYQHLIRSRRRVDLQRWRRSSSCDGIEAQCAREGVESLDAHLDLDGFNIDLYLSRRTKG